MKNIYLLPTDKPSRLCEFGSTWFTYKEPTDCFRNYNIYITSDENPKEGDWCLYNKNHDSKTPEWKLIKCGKIEREEMHPISDGRLLLWMVKVIMATDQDLVNDNVQAIDDDFLEYWINNPSCERVGVIDDYEEYLEKIEELEDSIGITPTVNKIRKFYKIILPNEDLKFRTVNVKSATDEDLGTVSYIPLPNVDFEPK